MRDNSTCVNITKYEYPFELDKIANEEIGKIEDIYVMTENESQCNLDNKNYNKAGTIMYVILRTLFRIHVVLATIALASIFPLTYLKCMGAVNP